MVSCWILSSTSLGQRGSVFRLPPSLSYIHLAPFIVGYSW